MENNEITEMQMEEPKKEKPLPFSIIDNKEKGKINIKFNTNYENPQFEQIVKELKSNGWKYAPSTKQWYPVGKALEKATDFALKLQEKYSEKKVPEKENEVSEYKGIKFFDRNYNEPEELTVYLNEHLSTHITLAETSVILEALEHENAGLLSNRNERLGLNSENKLIVFSRREGKIEIEELNDVKHLFNYALTKAGKDLQEIKEMQTKMQQKNPEVVNFMGSIYETTISRRESIVKQMDSIKESYFPEVAYSYDQIKAGLSEEEIKRINDETRYDSGKTFIPAEEIRKWKDAENLEDFHERNLVWYKVYTLFEEHNLHEENKLLLNRNYVKFEELFLHPEIASVSENIVPENLIHLSSEKYEEIELLENYVFEHDNAVLQKETYLSGYYKKPAEIILKACEALGYEVCVAPELKQLYVYDDQDKEKPYAEYDMYSLFELAEYENVLSKEELEILKEAEKIYDRSFKLAQKKIPYAEVPFSENSKFKKECEGVMPLTDFNAKLIETEKIMDKNEAFFNEGVSKYDDDGAYGKYADAREKGTLTPEQEYGFGSDKTDVVLHLFDGTPEMTTYSMSLDLGRIHCSIFDYVKETCTYPEVHDAINATEDRLYHPLMYKGVKEVVETIKNQTLEEYGEEYDRQIEKLRKIREKQKPLRSAWIANASDIKKADIELEVCQKKFADICKNFALKMYKRIPKTLVNGFTRNDLDRYVIKEIKNMIIEQTHKDSRRGYIENTKEHFDYAAWHDAMQFIPENTEELEQFIQEAVKEPEIKIEHNKENAQKVIYSRTSYRGWEFSPKKDFSVSSYVRPFDQSDRSGFILMTGLEGKDGFWNEKVNKELLHSEGWSKKDALYKALETLSVSPLTRDLLALKPEQTFKDMVSEYSVIDADTGKDVRNEILPDELLEELFLSEKLPEIKPGPDPHGVAEEILRIEKNKEIWRENHKSVNEGDTIGEDSVSEVMKLSDGVYEAVLSRDMCGADSAANYLIINKAVAFKCNKNIVALAEETDGLLVFRNKAYEAYIRKDLIDKKLCPLPSNSSDYYERLSEYVEKHPLKYIYLLENNAFNFESNLKKMIELEPEHKDILALGKKLISMASPEQQKKIGQKILKSGGQDEESMKKLFEKWSTPGIEQEKSKKKDGYPPRGES